MLPSRARAQILFNILRIYCDSQTSIHRLWSQVMACVRLLCQVCQSHKAANVGSVLELACGDYLTCCNWQLLLLTDNI